MVIDVRRGDRLNLLVADLVAALRDEVAPAPEPSVLVDIPEAARLLGVSRTTLYALMDSGELPSRKVGRRRLVPRGALDAYARGAETA